MFKNVILICTVLFLLFSCNVKYGHFNTFHTQSQKFEGDLKNDRDNARYRRTVKFINDNYYKNDSCKEIIDTTNHPSLNKLVSSLDSHASIVNLEFYGIYPVSAIGVGIKLFGKRCIIVDVEDNTPAKSSGLFENDTRARG
jgi:hypothetical protein